MAGSSWEPSPSSNRRQRPPLRPTCAQSSRSTGSGRWRWASNCSPPSTLRPRPRRHTRPLCTKSSVPSAAPLCDAWETPQSPEPQPATGAAGTTHRHARATRIPHRPSAREETTRRPRDHLLPPEDPAMDITPTAAESAVHRDNPGRANLAQEDPLVQPDKARPRNTLQQHLSVGHAGGKDVTMPGTWNGHPKKRG